MAINSRSKQSLQDSHHASTSQIVIWESASLASNNISQPARPISEEPDDDSFSDQSSASRSASPKMGVIVSKLSSFRDRKRETTASCEVENQAVQENWDQGSIQGLSILEEEPTFHPDKSANTRLHQLVPFSTIQAHYENLRARDGVILPPFDDPTASMHYLAPAHAQDDHPFYWTMLTDNSSKSEAYRKLRKARHSAYLLSKNGYRLDIHGSVSELEKHQRCRNCTRLRKNIKSSTECKSHLDTTCVPDKNGNKSYTCCGRVDPCQRHSIHEFEEPLQIYQDRFNSFVVAPEYDAVKPKRKAVVLDCEMVGLSGNFSELARLCVVDYFSGEVLLDCFVDPVERVTNWRSEYSGINTENMTQAKNNGSCLPNWRAARSALFKFIDEKTILIGAGLHNDLEILRLVHSQIVDSGILAQQKVGAPWNKTCGLKTLCKGMLDLDIQTSSTQGHSPVEDCMATREVVLWMTYMSGEKFEAWAVVKRLEEERRSIERQRKEKERKEKKLEEQGKASDLEPNSYQQSLIEGYGFDPSVFTKTGSDGEESLPARKTS